MKPLAGFNEGLAHEPAEIDPRLMPFPQATRLSKVRSMFLPSSSARTRFRRKLERRNKTASRREHSQHSR